MRELEKKCENIYLGDEDVNTHLLGGGQGVMGTFLVTLYGVKIFRTVLECYRSVNINS